MRKFYLVSVILILCTGIAHAQKGKNGAATINSANAIVNEYAALTADASAGTNFIKVANSALNSDSRFTSSLAQGDLVMIIQMQGATIGGDANDSTWGTVTNYNNCGLYEFSEVVSVPDNTTINLGCPLRNNYTAAGKVQVVRVPRYSSLTINSGDSLTCDPWNGNTGGVVCAEVSGNTIINAGAAINVSGQGFRGGILYNTPNVITDIDVQNYRSTSPDSGAMKGESIAGYQADYNSFGGDNSRGAPANGGGGGNDHNAGGGGGANAGIIEAWNGNGNPSLTDTNWAQAWNLEYRGFANATSSGGGRGGYTYSGGSPNPLTAGPGNTAWYGDYRENVGGKGGRPLDYSSGRLFLGGGGGAGHENNDVGGGGTNGGGLVFLLSYDSISGSGVIFANGAHGGNTDPSYGRDGAGGAGGGGTVVLSSTGVVSGISVFANGGDGGNQFISAYEAEGPGGGGSGGYIAISNGNITRTANGGASGTTDCPALTLFPPNGATSGGAGLPNEGFNPISISVSSVSVGPNVSICPGSSAVLSATGASSYNWSPSTGLSCDTCPNPVANPTATTTYSLLGACGSEADSVVVTVFSVQPPVLSATDSVFCPSDSTRISTSGSYSTYLWNTGDTTSYIYAENAGGYWVTVTDANGCSLISPHQNIRVYPVPSVSIVVEGEALSSFDANAYQWYYDDSIITGANTPFYIAQKPGNYAVQITDSNGCQTISNDEYITATGIAGLSANSSINIYPNPFNSVVFISNSDAGGYLEEMEIYDALGQRVLNKVFSKTAGVTETIDVSFLPAGVYLMNVKSESTNCSRLLIKE